MSLLKSAFTVSILTMISRVFGYIRDIFIASVLGAGILADTFLVAYRLPNFFRQISAEGAVNNAFVPLFSSKIVSAGKEEAGHFASQVCMWLFLILFGLTLAMMVFMPQVMQVLAYGFSDNTEKLRLTVTFGRILFPYLLLISMVSLFSGIVQSLGRFAAAAAAPVILNVCMVSGIVIGGYYTTVPAHVLSAAVVVAGLMQCAFLLHAVKKTGIHLKLCIPSRTEDVRCLFRRMVPGIIGGGVTQLNGWLNTIIATTLSGAVSYLYYADRVVQFPMALVGTAIGVALLPSLSKSLKAGQVEEVIDIQNRALELALLLTIPAAVGLFSIADHLIQVMFERGKFGDEATLATAAALKVYALGLPAFVMIKIFLPSYFAAGDTRTPVKIAIISVLVDVLLSVILKFPFGHIGIATGSVVAAWLNAALLWTGLVRLKRYVVDAPLKRGVIKICLASAAMCVTILLMDPWAAAYIRQWHVHATVALAMLLAVLVIAGGGVFLAVCGASGGLRVMHTLWNRKS